MDFSKLLFFFLVWAVGVSPVFSEGQVSVNVKVQSELNHFSGRFLRGIKAEVQRAEVFLWQDSEHVFDGNLGNLSVSVTYPIRAFPGQQTAYVKVLGLPEGSRYLCFSHPQKNKSDVLSVEQGKQMIDQVSRELVRRLAWCWMGDEKGKLNPGYFSNRFLVDLGEPLEVELIRPLEGIRRPLSEVVGEKKWERTTSLKDKERMVKDLAQRAGLGWVGKNGCLISRKHGSFFLIGAWLTSLNFDTPPTHASNFHCGKCTKCLDACPTDAFIQPGLLNANLCLSTHTIENRGSFPKALIGTLKTQAFGCDICQDVCPWNRKHFPNHYKETLPDLDALLQLPENDFRNYFRKTPMERPSWAGLKRNFLILAADQLEIPETTLAIHLKDERQLIRETAQDVLNYRKSLKKKPRSSD